MTSSLSLLAGLVVGLSVAAPVGPMGLLCMQRTLASGLGVGLSTGLGGATANVVYGAVVILGLNSMASWVESNGRLLSALGGVFLLWSAIKTFRRRQSAAVQTDQHTHSAGSAYISAVFYNLANPTSVVLILALLSPIVGASATLDPGVSATLDPAASATLDPAASATMYPGVSATMYPGASATTQPVAAALLLGMFVGVAGWWLAVTGTIALLRSRLTPTAIAYVNRGAGMLLTGYGFLALARSAGVHP